MEFGPAPTLSGWSILAGGIYPACPGPLGDPVGATVAPLPARSDLVGGLLFASLFTLTLTSEFIRTIITFLGLLRLSLTSFFSSSCGRSTLGF